jgi:hypothetical protein
MTVIEGQAVEQGQEPSKPTARAKPTAPGPRAKGLKDQAGSLEDKDSTGADRS